MTVQELKQQLNKYPDDMKLVVQDNYQGNWEDVNELIPVKITEFHGVYCQSPGGEEMLKIE